MAGAAVSAANTGSAIALAAEAASTSFLGIAVDGRNSGGSGGRGQVGLSAALGGYGFHSVTGGYGPFTGQHDALIRKGEECLPGSVVCDVAVIAKDAMDDTLTEVTPCTRVGDKRVVGVVASDMMGHGVRQTDDIMRSCTVAKARESVTFANPDGVRLISCIYHCG